MKSKTTLDTFQYIFVEGDELLDSVLDRILQVLTENNLYASGITKEF